MTMSRPLNWHDTTASWSEYWLSAQTGVLAQDGSDFVGDMVRDFWISQRPEFAASHHVVDIGSGNAFLATVLYPDKFSDSTCPQWTCIDIAQVHLPTSHLHLANRVSILANTHFETALPLEFRADWLVSSFGLEYTDLELAPAVCKKNLGPGGQCVFLMHSTNSLIHRQSLSELGDILFLTEESDVFAAAAQLLPHMAASKLPSWAPDALADAARRRYNLAIDLVKRRISLGNSVSVPLMQVLTALQKILHQVTVGSTESAVQWVVELKRTMSITAIRIQNMTEVALDAVAIEALARRFDMHGFKVNAVASLSGPLGEVGWVFRARSN